MFRFRHPGGLHLTRLLLQKPQSYSIRHANHLRVAGARSSSLLMPSQSWRLFASQQQEAQEPLDELELEALAIQKGIDEAKEKIEKNIQEGLGLSRRISAQVEEDKYEKMQRYDIFISKMEELKRAEEKWARREQKALQQMQSAYMTSGKPLKDLLHYYSKASVKGFESSLMMNTLHQILMTLRARGNEPRPYEDYSTRELDGSWRMQMLASHLTTALRKDLYFNHYHMGQASRLLGEIGFKDVEVIQAYFDKLNRLLEEREAGYEKPRRELDFEEVVYGGFLNFLPRHYVFEGFDSNEEFQQHLTTLLEWQVGGNDGLKNLEVEPSKEIIDLEQSMAQLIAAASTVNDLNVNVQASIDSLRQQYFKIQEANDKYEWMKEHKFIRLELLELQEMLVKAGYILPEEAEQFSSSQPREVRMERAARIFYEYVQACAPEFMSPQYEDFIKAAHESVDARQKPKKIVPLDEEHDKISLSSLSQSLVGLSSQALSYRRESNGKDYLHKYYEDLALEKERVVQSAGGGLEELSPFFEEVNVAMARDYLKAYKIFDDEVQKIQPKMMKLIEQSSSDAEGLLHGLLALSACKIEAPTQRLMIFDNFKKLISQEKPPSIRTQALVDGLRGVALQYQQTAQSAEVAKFCLEKLEKDLGPLPEQSLTFDQRLDILWSSCALGLEKDSNLVKDLYQGLQLLHFQRTSNDLTYQQFQKVRDFQLYLTEISSVKDEAWVKQHTNPILQLLSKNPRFHEDRYAEKAAKFDPFKKRVLLGLARGLTMASIDHQLSLEENLVSQTDAEVAANEEIYPYQPDIIIGHNGEKVLLEVITASQTMRDIGKPDGCQTFRYKILKGLQAGRQDFKVVAVPVTSVVNYDIENRKIEMKEDYNFVEDFEQQLKDQGGGLENPIHFGSLPKFGANITGEASTYLASLVNSGDKQRLDGFLKQLYKLFQIKHHTEKQYEPAMFQQGLDQLKFELMKLSLVFEALPEHQKAHLQKLVPSDGTENQTFQDMINEVRDKTNWTVKSGKNLDEHKIEGIDLQWMGTRQEVELPQSKELKFTKSLMPEMINQRFMWVDDYFHYKDWEQAQKEVFDSFNLLVVPRNEGEYKYFYNRGTHQRIIPQGIFPSPNAKRHLLKPSINQYAGELQELRDRGNDSVTLFEKDPMKFLVLKEEARSSQLKDLTQDVSFITNLQNLKHGLKSDYTDKQIVDLILGNSHFTDQLIVEHLRKGTPREKGRQDPTFAPRDPGHYRAFVHATYQSKDQEDPFTHFFIKEAGKIERIHKVHNDAEEKYAKLINDNPDPESRKKAEELRKTLEDKVIDMLLENRLENEDTISLSHQIESEVKIEYHLKSLMRSEFVHDVDPDLVNEDLSDAAFLALQRRRAETKLIKAKIIYKQHEGLPLSANEMRYLRAWAQDIQTNEKINFLNVRDSMLQQSRSALTIGEALSAEDLYALNQVPQVELKREEHGQYALSDLVLEMSHFIDDDFVNRIEMQMISNRIKKQWKLADDFSVVETRNKEISLIINELEELAWRMAGGFDEREMSTIKTMFSVARNRDHFDKQFYETDMKSMDEFVESINQYDDRAKLLEEWAVRKEEEWKARAALPPKHLQKSDSELHKIVDRKLKKAREALVAQLLERQASGSTKKEYLDLTTADMSKIAEQLVIRLGLFNGEYPAFLPQLVRAVMEHPNLPRAEYSKIDTFCQMFELDWRGDRALSNKKEFLATNPVYVAEADRSNFEGYGTVGNFEVTAMLRQACVPFVAELTDQLLKKAASRGSSSSRGEQSKE